MIDTQELNRIADITQVLSCYGIYQNRAGFINCIAHRDSRPSMKVYPATNSVHCFSCGADFNSVGVVMQIENCTFLQACDKLKAMFGISDDRKSQAEIRRKMQAIAEEKRRQKAAENKLRKQYNKLCEHLHFLQEIYHNIVPYPLTDDFREDEKKVGQAMDLGLEIVEIENKLEAML